MIAALTAVVKKQGFGALPLCGDAEALLSRIRLAKRLGEEDLPAFDYDTLTEELPTWLGPWFADEVTPRTVLDALRGRLNREQLTALDRFLPLQIEIRPGVLKKIDYSNPDQPVIRGRMQEFYGLDSILSVARGKLILSVELLSPARRPLQTTPDLGSFWKGSYPSIRGEMRGRYPKHYWPDNPAEAEPSLATGLNRPD